MASCYQCSYTLFRNNCDSFTVHKIVILISQEKIDLDFYPVSTCTPTDMISIHSDITVYDQLYKEENGGKIGSDGELNMNQADYIKEDAGYDVIKQSDYNPDTTNQSLATSDSGHYVELSNTRLETSMPSQCTPVKTLLPTHHTTIDTEPISATATTDTGKPRVSTQSDSVQETSFGYVLEEDMPAMKTTYHVDQSAIIADNYKVQTRLDVLNLKRDGSDSFVVVEKMM